MSSAVAIFIPMLEKSRRSYFNDNKSLSQVDKAAFTNMYSHVRNPHSTNISLDTKNIFDSLKKLLNSKGEILFIILK